MRKAIIRIMALALALTLCAMGALAQADENGILDGKYVNPIVITHAVEADAAQKFGEGQSYDHNVWTELFMEKLGIDLQVAWSADNGTDAFKNKLNMAIASEDLPDLFRTYYGVYAEAANAGLLADMTDLIDQYGSDRLKEIMNQYPELVEGCKINGRLYCIPEFGASVDLASQFLWIRQDYLDAVGMTAPTTWDELLAVARAFATQDPDGNGVNDTYGLGLSGADPWWGGVATIEGICQAFHATGNQLWIKNDEGQIVYGGVQPAMKEALAAAAAMYQEGLIDPDFATKSFDTIVEDIYQGKIGMCFGQNWAGYWPLMAVVEENPNAVWKPYPFVSADDQPAHTAVWWPLGNFNCVAASCEHPEAAVLIANLYVETLNDDTPAEVSAIYDYAGDVSAYMLCPVRLSKSGSEIDTYYAVKGVKEGTVKYEDLTGKIKSNYDYVQAYLDGDVTYYGYWSQLGLEGTAGIAADVYAKEGRVDLTALHGGFPAEWQGEMNMIMAKEVEYYAKIVSGKLPIDAFEDWVSDFNAMSGDKITATINEMYNK